MSLILKCYIINGRRISNTHEAKLTTCIHNHKLSSYIYLGWYTIIGGLYMDARLPAQPQSLPPPDRPGVSICGRDERELFQVPEVDCAVVRGRGEQELMRMELHITHWSRVLGKLSHHLPRAEVP